VHGALPAPPMQQGAAACGRGGHGRSHRTGPAPESARIFLGPRVLRRAARSCREQIGFKRLQCSWQLQPQLRAAESQEALSLPTLHKISI
jgi:hypothetical protein